VKAEVTRAGTPLDDEHCTALPLHYLFGAIAVDDSD
jgi:hypothetical protein